MLDLTVAVLVDPEVLIQGSLRFCAGEPDRHVVEGLRHILKRVVIKPFEGPSDLIDWARREKPDVVFNLTEHANDNRAWDTHVVAILDLLGISYTGPTARGLMLCRDKAYSKLIARREGFHTPEFVLFDRKDREIQANLRLPYVVKPRFGDSSEGITRASLVRSRDGLKRQIERLFRVGIDDIIAEEYIQGREMLVNFVYDRVMFPREYFLSNGNGHPFLACTHFKMDPKYRRSVLRRVDAAQVTRRQHKELCELTLRTTAALELRDFGRLDVRLTPSGEWVFLEANPNPSLIPSTRTWSGTWTGIRHTSLLEKIVLSAYRRGKQKRRARP